MSPFVNENLDGFTEVIDNLDKPLISISFFETQVSARMKRSEHVAYSVCNFQSMKNPVELNSLF